MKLINKSKLLAAVCIADLLLLGGLIHTVRGEMPAHVSADEGSWVREGGDTLDRAKGLEGKCVALTFDDDVIIGLSQEISYKEAVSMI